MVCWYPLRELWSPPRQHGRARAAAHVWPACGTRQRAVGRPSLGGGARGEDLAVAHLRGVARNGRQRRGRQYLGTASRCVAAMLAEDCTAPHRRMPRQPVALCALTLTPMPPVPAQRVERRPALHAQHLEQVAQLLRSHAARLSRQRLGRGLDAAREFQRALLLLRGLQRPLLLVCEVGGLTLVGGARDAARTVQPRLPFVELPRILLTKEAHLLARECPQPRRAVGRCTHDSLDAG
eukprot:scaffold626_cov60-Phaeocystis_antarctica.AAC.13